MNWQQVIKNPRNSKGFMPTQKEYWVCARCQKTISCGTPYWKDLYCSDCVNIKANQDLKFREAILRSRGPRGDY